ncbi:hypothetical protein F5Y11DRAFT_353288 [Daldinia sp. FL1419]|nr:hypothetical protein F5Y11DRAFT_353288 [Daldinia sp. FL1419]
MESRMIGHLEVKRSEGMGLGLFTTRNIPKGTIINYELGFMYKPRSTRPDTTEHGIYSFCDVYKSADQASRNRLNDHSYNPQFYEQNKKLLPLFKAWIAKNNPKKEIEPGLDYELENAEALLKSYAIYWTNCAGTPDNGACIFGTFAYTNHSCVPNTIWEVIGDPPFFLRMTTKRAITAGEEITVTYLDFGRTELKRRQEQLANWGFRCRCPRCTEEERVGSVVYWFGTLGGPKD